MQPNGAKKNKLAQAIFSKDGPNLIKPEVTNNPKVIPNIYITIFTNYITRIGTITNTQAVGAYVNRTKF